MPWELQQRNGIYLPQIDWHLDARKPVKRAFVSHAHFDHMGDHSEIVCSSPTAALIQRRMPGNRKWRVQEFGETFELNPGVEACLYPAGHITGSAMLLLKTENGSLLYTGDFKLSEGTLAEACQPVEAETLIIETTYGIPRYTFPPEAEIAADIVRFCRDTLENGETPVLFGYSLGKSQSILRWLADSNLEAMLHPKSLELTKTCEELGWKFPPYQPFVDNSHKGKVIISPPQPKNSSWISRIHKPKTAIITGWAIDPSATYRYQCDKAFPLSDHADYLDLQTFVARVNPKRVYTVHGFAQEFAQTLREQGYEALALGKENQLELDVSTENIVPATVSQPEQFVSNIQGDIEPNSFQALCNCSKNISKTDSFVKRVEILSEYLSVLDSQEVTIACKLLSGKPVVSESGEVLEIDRELMQQAVLSASETSLSEYKAIQKLNKNRISTYQQLLAKCGGNLSRDLQYISNFVRNFCAAPSPTFRFSFLSEELRKIAPEQSIELIRVIEAQSDSVKIATIEEAIAKRFGRDPNAVQRAHRRCDDLDKVISAADRNTLSEIEIQPFKPVPYCSIEKVDTSEELFESLNNRTWIENEYDGIRCQFHKVGEHAEIYDSHLNRITHQFPELVEASKLIPQNFIAEASIVAWGYERPLPLSDLSARLSRKGEELFLGEEIEVIAWLTDLFWINENDILDSPLSARRRHLDTFTVNESIRISPVTYLENPLDLDHLADAAIRRGNLGIVCKDPESEYDLNAEPNSCLSFRGTESTQNASKRKT